MVKTGAIKLVQSFIPMVLLCSLACQSKTSKI